MTRIVMVAYKMIRVLAVLMAILFTRTVNAAVTANSAILPQAPDRGIQKFTSASTPGTFTLLFTAGSNGSDCRGLIATSSDSISHQLTVELINSTTAYPLASINIGAAPTGGLSEVSLMSNQTVSGWAYDSPGNYVLRLVSGDTVNVTFATAITSGTTIQFFLTECGDY